MCNHPILLSLRNVVVCILNKFSDRNGKYWSSSLREKKNSSVQFNGSKIVSTGFGSATFAVMPFFHRKIAAPPGSGIPPPGPRPRFLLQGVSNPSPYSFDLK